MHVTMVCARGSGTELRCHVIKLLSTEHEISDGVWTHQHTSEQTQQVRFGSQSDKQVQYFYEWSRSQSKWKQREFRCVCVYWQRLGQPCGSVTPSRLCWELKQIERCGLLAKGPPLCTLAASTFTTLWNLSCNHCLHSYITSTLSHSISFPHSYSETGHIHNRRAGKTRHNSRSYWLQNPWGLFV